MMMNKDNVIGGCDPRQRQPKSKKSQIFQIRLQLVRRALWHHGLDLPFPLAVLILMFGGRSVDASSQYVHNGLVYPVTSTRGAKRRRRDKDEDGNGIGKAIRLKRYYRQYDSLC